MEMLISSLVGGIIGLLLSLVFEDQLLALKIRFFRWVRKLSYRPKSPVTKPVNFTLGNFVTQCLVVDGDGELEYLPHTILCRVDNQPCLLPPEIATFRQEISLREAAKKSNGESSQWNGPLYALERYAIGRTVPDENLELALTFRPADYYTFQATIASLDTPFEGPQGAFTLRQKYLQGQDLAQPIPFLANGFGVVLTVITKDNKLVLTRRHPEIGVRAGQLDASIAEGLHPNLDRSTTSKAPDLYRTAIRGVQEELGIQIVQEDIHFLGFALDTEFYQWALVGAAYCAETAQEIFEMRSRGTGGKWEVHQIEALDVKPREILALLKREKIWSLGFVSIYFTLMKECGKEKVNSIARDIFS